MEAAIQYFLEILLYPLMLLIAAYLNKRSDRTLLLLFSVALTYFLPTDSIKNYYLWYAVCIGAELSVLALSYNIRVISSYPLACLTTLLLISHFTSMLTKKPEVYGVVAVYLEHLQMLTFIVASPLIINKLKRKMRCLV